MIRLRAACAPLLLCLALAPAAFAQTPPAATPAPAAPAPWPVNTTVGTVLTGDEVKAIGLAARAKGSPTAPMVTGYLFAQGPFHVNVEQRVAPTTPSIHLKDAEMFVVVDGAGIASMGGELVDPNPRGANILGSAIKGGETKPIKKGDFIFIPAGTPHGFVDVSGTLTMMALHMTLPAS